MTEIHELVYFGNGGFTYQDVWNMPVSVRRFHLMSINEHLQKIHDAKEGNSGKKLTNSMEISEIVSSVQSSGVKRSENSYTVKKAPK